MLMRAEYRNQIDQKYSKKIEAIVRKAPRGIKEMEETIQDESLPCPVCNTDLPIMDVTCTQCKTTLPICIATVNNDQLYTFHDIKSRSNDLNSFQGNHISKNNLAACPACDFLCLNIPMIK